MLLGVIGFEEEEMLVYLPSVEESNKDQGATTVAF